MPTSDAIQLAAVADDFPVPTGEERELGVSLITGPFTAPYDFGSQGEVPNPYDEITLDQMLDMRKKDGQARALFRLMSLPIRSAAKNVTWIPSNGGEQEAQFISDMFSLPRNQGGMTTPWHRFMAQQCLGIFDGTAPFEQVYWVPDRGPLKGKWTLKKFAYRPPSTVTYLADRNGGFNGFRQKTTFQGRVVDVVIKPRDAYYYAANEEENPFYGVSYFLPAFYHYDKKLKLYYIMHLAAQHRATSNRVGKYPPNASRAQIEDFSKQIRDFGLAGAMTIPEDFDVEELGKSLNQFNFVDMVNHHNNQMSKSVLGQDILDSADNKSMVDFGQKDSEFFVIQLQTIMTEMASNLEQHVAPKFIDWNFGSGNYPACQFGKLTDEQVAAVQAIFNVLSSSASTKENVSPEFMLELEKEMAESLGLIDEIDYDAVKARMEKEQKALEDMQEAARKAAVAPPAPVPAPAPESKGQGAPGSSSTPRTPLSNTLPIQPGTRDLMREILDEMYAEL